MTTRSIDSANSSCDDYTGLLVREADGSLDPEGHARLAAHLTSCAACRDALASQRSVHEALRAAAIVPASVGFDRRVMAAVRNETPWIARWNWRAWTLRLAPIPAALLIVVILMVRSQTTAASTTNTAMSVTSTTEVSDALWSPAVSETSLLSLMLTAKPDDKLADHLKDK